MTLVLSLTTPDFALQVSDRRLTRAGIPIDSEANKAIVWCNLLTIAFTGLAFVDRQQTVPTDLWAARQLFGAASVKDVVDQLTTSASDQVRRLSYRDKRIAFSVAGWLPQRPDAPEPFVPFQALVSNFHDGAGRVVAMQEEFQALISITPRGSWAMTHVGVDLSGEEVAALNQATMRFSREGSSRDRFARLLAHVIRRVADRTPLVGRSLMVTCLPRASLGSNPMMFLTERGGQPSQDAATFFYLGPDSKEPQAFGPHWVCGNQGFTDFKARWLNSTGSDAEISVTLL